MAGLNELKVPLLIFYDCECSSGEHLKADIIEIAARCFPEIRNASFESLISTSQDLGRFTIERCGIKESDLEGKPAFPVVFNRFLKWIEKLVLRVNQKFGKKHFPVLCAHGGNGFDYPILLSNMRRYNVKEGVMKNKNLHFADTFLFCKELQEGSHVPELQGIRLSMDSLFSQFSPGKEFLNRHRAMGDVNAMVEIFSKEPLRTAINNIKYTTSESLWEWFETQNSQKEQRIILEEKMAKLDAFTRNVYSKKLFQLQLTYDTLQSIFEKCCSYMDFYAVLKDRGIDRKTAKYFACQFGGMGLKNQGTEPYCDLPKSAVANSEEIDYSLKNVDQLLAEEELKRKATPNVRPLPNETTSFERMECWEDELDETRSFTFTVPKPEVPLSLTIDDFVSPSKSVKFSEQNVSKHRNKTSERQKGRQVYNETSVKNDPASRIKTGVSRGKNQNNTNAFRNNAFGLQSGKFSDKKGRYKLEKQLSDRMEKVCDESNTVKKETREESKKIMKDTNVEKSSKSNLRKDISEKVQAPKQKETMRGTSYQNTPGNEKIFNNHLASSNDSRLPKETSATNYTNSSGKFVGKTRRDTRNKKKFDGRNQGSLTSSDVKKNSAKDSQDTISSTKRKDVFLKQKSALKQAVLKKSPQSNDNKLPSSASKTLKMAKAEEEFNGLETKQRTVEADGDATKKIAEETDASDGKESYQESTASVMDKQGEERSTIIGKTEETTTCCGGEESQRSSKTTKVLNGLQNIKLLQGDAQDIQKSTVTNLNEKREKKEKLKRNTKQNREPVVFVNRKYTDEKRKMWPRLEIFVGDLPIYVPVEPTEDDLSNIDTNKTIGYSLEDNPTGTSSWFETNSGSTSIVEPGDISESVTLSNDVNVPGTHLENDDIYNWCHVCSSNELEVQIFDENEVKLNEKPRSGVDSSLRDAITSSPVESVVVVETNELESKMKSSLVSVSSNEIIPSLDDSTSSYVGKTSDEDEVEACASRVTRVETADTSQQTMLNLPWEKDHKRFVDEEQQTDCAVETACNIEIIECVQMVDKETNTERFQSKRVQTIDSPSASHSPTNSPCFTDSQYEIMNGGECESPTRIFDSLFLSSCDGRQREDDGDCYDIPSPNEFQQIYRLGGIYPNPPNDLHRVPQRFLNTTQFPPLLPQLYPLNSNHGPNPPMLHPRYPQPSRMPRNHRNVFHQRGLGIYKF